MRRRIVHINRFFGSIPSMRWRLVKRKCLEKKCRSWLTFQTLSSQKFEFYRNIARKPEESKKNNALQVLFGLKLCSSVITSEHMPGEGIEHVPPLRFDYSNGNVIITHTSFSDGENSKHQTENYNWLYNCQI